MRSGIVRWGAGRAPGSEGTPQCALCTRTGHCPAGQTRGRLWAVRWILGRTGSADEELTANPGRDAVVRVSELDLELPALLVPAGLWSGTAGDPALKSAAAIVAGNAVAGLRPDSRWAIYEGFSYCGKQEEAVRHRLPAGRPCLARTKQQYRDLLACGQRGPRKSPGESAADAPSPGFPGGTTIPLYAAATAGGDLLLQ